MNHRLKLFFGIFTWLITGVVFFGFIVYGAAVKASFERESKMLENFSHYFVNDVFSGLEQSKITENYLINWLENVKGNDFILAVLENDKKYNMLSIVGVKNEDEYFITQLIKNERSGSRSLKRQAYNWTSVQISDSPYYLLIIHHIGSGDANSYFKSLGVPIIIAALLMLWSTLWVTLYIGNLYQKISNRKNALEYQSQHDSLTGLKNRNSFLLALNVNIFNARRKNRTLSLCYLNVDNLKKINQSFGHQFGDDLLIEIASRCTIIVDEKGLVARLSAAEFTMLLIDCDASETQKMADEVLQRLSSEFLINDVKLNITVNMGIVMYPQHGTSVDELLQRAEIASLNAKKIGSRISIFHDNLLEFYSPNLALVAEEAH